LLIVFVWIEIVFDSVLTNYVFVCLCVVEQWSSEDRWFWHFSNERSSYLFTWYISKNIELDSTGYMSLCVWI
jgi:hypothetical protein